MEPLVRVDPVQVLVQFADDDIIDLSENILSNHDEIYLQQDMRWWREVQRPRLCVAVLPERQQRSRMFGRV